MLKKRRFKNLQRRWFLKLTGTAIAFMYFPRFGTFDVRKRMYLSTKQMGYLSVSLRCFKELMYNNDT